LTSFLNRTESAQIPNGTPSTQPELIGTQRNIQESIKNLIELYEAWDEPEKAKKWRSKLPHQARPESSKKSPLSAAKKHHDLRVTSCLQNVSAHTNFARSESEKMSSVCQNGQLTYEE